jgi:hypothetical protein
MVNFDYQIHSVVGILNTVESSGNGYVKVYGYIEDGVFHKLSSLEASSIFEPDGEVFAHRIQQDYYDLNNSLVCLYVLPNTKEGGKNSYLWNKSYEVEPIGVRIKNLKEKLGIDGDMNFKILSSNNLLGNVGDVFIHSGDRLYHVNGENDSRIIPFCKFDNDLPIIESFSGNYYMEANLPTIEGYVDIASDEQIVDWFLRIAKKDWSDIQTGSGRAVLLSAREALLTMKDIPVSIALSRFERLQSLMDTFVISRDSLSAMAKAPWFKPSIDAAVDRYKEDYLGTVKQGYQKELEELHEAHKVTLNEEKTKLNEKIAVLRESIAEKQAEHDEKILKLHGQISDAQSELDQLISDIGQKRQELNEVEEELGGILERKDEIINGFKIVQKVLGLSAKAETPEKQPKVSINLTSTNYSEKRLPFYKGFENNLYNCLELLSLNRNSIASELTKLHACYGVLLLPNMDVAMAIVAAAGRAFYHVAYVSVAWKSFDDVWSAGLQQIVAHCDEEPDTVHYFVLRNINLSCLSNYLQPLADMMAGFSEAFPNTEIKFPDNLRILLTVSDEDLIPLSEGIIRYFGCVPKSIETKAHEKISYANATCYGYLDTNLLHTASKEITEELSNYFAEYVDE